MTNASGIYPIRDLVLILPEQEVEHKDTIIIIPESIKQNERSAQVFGTLVAVGDVAFSYEDKNYGSKIREKMVPGTRVMFAKYHGIVVQGEDGKDYRLLQDDDVAAIVNDTVQKPIEH